jgi:hypothetical protein
MLATLCHSASATPQNQLHLAECTCSKSGVVGCDALREKLGLGAKPATPNNVRHPLHAHNSATAAPQNQLQLAECTCRKINLKICTVGGDVIRGVALKVS